MRSLRAARRWVAAVLIVALSGCAAGSRMRSPSVAVRGKVTVAPQTAGAAPDATPRDAVVYLDAAQVVGAGRPPEPGAAVVRVTRRFEPRVTAISVGSKIRFENRDVLYHSVFSVSPTKRFDTGLFAPEHAKTLTFDQPGIIELHCGIDDAVGYVIVIPYGMFARPDARGAFTLASIPPGTWTLKAWHPAWGVASAPAEVGSQSRPVTLRFSGTHPRTSALP